MSIYMSNICFPDEHGPKCAQVTKLGRKVYGIDESKPCTCGQSPILYQGSHVLPSNRDRRGGHFHLAAIPGHISRTGRPPLSEDFMPYHPWLRVSIDGCGDDPTVILDRKQVVALRDELNRWLRELPREEK
jgi:hypothetical protein